jgi:uncharacterized membrane protein HdeD (DUF308 family)
VEAFGDDERGRTWRVIAGVLFIVGGVVLIRHLNLTLALIGLIIGAVWIIQGVLALVAGISVGRGATVGWMSLVFGGISLAAGVVVISTPLNSVTVLAVLLGIWFVVMGVLEMAGALTVRGARPAASGQVNVPGQRPGGSAATDSVPGGSSASGRKVQG